MKNTLQIPVLITKHADDALRRYAEKNGMKRTAVARVAINNFLTEKGYLKEGQGEVAKGQKDWFQSLPKGEQKVYLDKVLANLKRARSKNPKVRKKNSPQPIKNH